MVANETSPQYNGAQELDTRETTPGRETEVPRFISLAEAREELLNLERVLESYPKNIEQAKRENKKHRKTFAALSSVFGYVTLASRLLRTYGWDTTEIRTIKDHIRNGFDIRHSDNDKKHHVPGVQEIQKAIGQKGQEIMQHIPHATLQKYGTDNTPLLPAIILKGRFVEGAKMLGESRGMNEKELEQKHKELEAEVRADFEEYFQNYDAFLRDEHGGGISNGLVDELDLLIQTTKSTLIQAINPEERIQLVPENRA
ncbi:MAG TPA: hypothetical protein DCS29_01410 [Candidatus Magasanikbacteria bacterium]|nr:hypothetical protein [Candidatus Magasanikbacteria bacterium]